MEKKAGSALTALILMLACPALSPGQEEKLDKIRVARASDSATESALWFTKEGGFFEKHGISAELIRLQGSSLVVSTMLAGEIALSQGGAAAVVDSGLPGGDLTNDPHPGAHDRDHQQDEPDFAPDPAGNRKAMGTSR